MIVTLDAKHRVSIPAALAPPSPGDQFDAGFDPDEDVVILRRVSDAAGICAAIQLEASGRYAPLSFELRSN